MVAPRLSFAAVLDPAFIDPSLDARAATFESPTGGRGCWRGASPAAVADIDRRPYEPALPTEQLLP